MSTALALSLIGALCVLSLGTAAWSVVMHLTRRPSVTPAELHQQVTALRLEVSELVDKFTASQKRAAVRAMRERADERESGQMEMPLDPMEVKRRLRARAFGGNS